MRILWVAAGVLTAVVVAGCTSRTAGSARSGPSTSAESGSVTTTATGNSPSASSGDPTSSGPADQSTSAPAGSGTTKVVVRPVNRAGRLSPGFSAVPESGDPVVCDRHYASPVAVDAGIIECGDTALYGVACWPVVRYATALCYRDPFGRQLAQIPAQFVTKLPVTHEPAVPFGLELDNGEHCKIRDGGAWSKPEQQPSYVGYYQCDSDFQDAVWGPPDDYKSGGINQSSPQWTVIVGAASGKGPLVRHRVVSARFVGMAS